MRLKLLYLSVRGLFIPFLFCLLVESCETDKGSDSAGPGFVTIIIENCPNQKSTTQLGGHLTQVDYSTIAYIDGVGDLVSYEPRRQGKDTVIIPTYCGYAEIMHLYKAIEFDYYLLKDGDTVYVSYDSQERPHFRSLKSELYTELYNLPYSVKGAIQSKGYHIKTLLTHPQFVRPYNYFKQSELQNKYPELATTFKDRYVDLDSLSIVYDDYITLIESRVNTLRKTSVIEPAYVNYLKRSVHIGDSGLTQDALRSDSLMHYVSNYIKAQQYREGEIATVLFDEIAKDTTITELAKRGILKRLIRRIKSGESGWHPYPDYIVEDYLSHYYTITGDTSFFHSSLNTTPCTKNKPSLFNTSVEDVSGLVWSLDDLIENNRGQVLYVDIWASWCAPCLAQMPYSQRLQKQLAQNEVTFLFLSIDADSVSWHNAIGNAPMMQHTYRFLSPDNEFTRKLNITTIPRYIIIGAEGNIINANADRPASHTIETELKRLSDEYEKTDY